MTLPVSGPISLHDIQQEFGGPASPISLGSYYKNGPYVTSTCYAPGVPTSGPIAVSDFYGARRLSFYTYTYTSDTSFVLPSSFWGTLSISNMLGGGGGGGGGPDRFGSGYPGSAGAVVNGNISANPGDTVNILVGQPGQPGYDGNGAAGGAGGSTGVAWSSLNLMTNPNILRVTNGAYVGFLNQYGVWNYNSDYPTFDQTTVVNFPFTGNYTIVGSCDNYGTVYVDGSPVLDMPGYQATYANQFYVTAGNHSVRLYGVNTGGPGSLGVTIDGGFEGGRGGNSGYSGVSGSGGGGGSATALLINSVARAVAGGGGGGGGAGQYSSGIANGGIGGNGNLYYGSQGQDKGGDGGGGGGGGGGYYGGLGGNCNGGDDGAYSGQSGGSLIPPGGTLTSGSNGGGQDAPGTGGTITVSYYA